MKFIQENVLKVAELAKQRVKAMKKIEELKVLKASGEDILD